MPVNEAFSDDISDVKYKDGEQIKQDHDVQNDVTIKHNARSYDIHEAIELTGNGWYNQSLCLLLGLCLTAMVVEMFGFSVLVVGASCDLQLTLQQQSFITSVPFIGACVMCYPWGYVCDTQGRRRALITSLIISSVLSITAAFSPDWITLTLIKFLSASSCSCAQSTTYTLMVESSIKKYGKLFIGCLTAFAIMAGPLYIVVAYPILNLDMEMYTVGRFTSWRVLSLVLSTPLILSSCLLVFFCESPHFLAEQGRDQEALSVLHNIYRRNGGAGRYPVQELSLVRPESLPRKSLLKSLLDQTTPLFKPPLLKHTLQMYYLIGLNFFISNTFFMLIPLVVNIYFERLGADDNVSICELISQRENTLYASLNETKSVTPCIDTINYNTMISAVTSGAVLVMANLLISLAASRKKLLLLLVYLVSGLSTVIIHLITNPAGTIIAYYLIIGTSVAFSIINIYFTELFPTSHRGMVMCVSVLVSRLGSILGMTLLGTYIYTHCLLTFYACGLYIFSGILVILTLPGDKPQNVNTG